MEYTSKVGMELSTTFKCGKCEHVWQSNLDHPVRCPNCGTYRWSEKRCNNQCLMCGHKWFSRSEQPPIRCPSCKTRSWSTGEKRTRGPNIEMKPEDKIIMDMYNDGDGCIRISLKTNKPLSSIYNTVKKALGNDASPRM